MQIKIISFYEDHWMPPATDHAQWDHLCRAYSADLQMIRRWEEAIIEPDEWVVLLDEDGYMDLAEIGDIDKAVDESESGVFPEKITLVFGRSAQNLITYLPEGSWNFAFKITTPQAIPMFGVNAASIALFALDQWSKNKQQV